MEMKLTAIPINDYFIMVSDEKPNIGDYTILDGELWKLTEITSESNYFGVEASDRTSYRSVDKIKVIAQSKEVHPGLSLFDAPSEWSEDVDFKRLVGVSIGAASMCWSEKPKGVFDSVSASKLVEDIIAAKEKHEFTMEDMKRVIEQSVDKGRFFNSNPIMIEEYKEELDAAKKEIIQSLQKPKSYSVEIEMEELNLPQGVIAKNVTDLVHRVQLAPKLTNNKITITSWKEIY